MNVAESTYDVVSNIQPVLAAFIASMREEMPNLAYVYDPDLSYETAVPLLRDRNNQLGISSEPLPLLAFRMSTLRHPDDTQAPNRRLNKKTISMRIGDSMHTFDALHGEMDVDLLYITKSMDELERFQIAYLAEVGISGTKELTVNMGQDIGDIKYFAQYNELLDITLNVENNYYKALVTSVKIRGFYLIFKNAGGIIKTIINNYHNYIQNPKDGILLETITMQG
jgi:hypothetical protein